MGSKENTQITVCKWSACGEMSAILPFYYGKSLQFKALHILLLKHDIFRFFQPAKETLQQVASFCPNTLHRLSVFNRISHMFDRRTRMAYFNGLVLPHCDYAGIVWGDQPGLESEMEKLQVIQNRFVKKTDGSKQSSAEAMASLKWIPLARRRFWTLMCCF